MIDDLMAARSGIRALAERYRAQPAFLLLGNPTSAPRPDIVRNVALFDTAAQAADYEVAARLPTEERGAFVAGVGKRYYREGTLLQDFAAGIWIPETDGDEVKARALMIQPAPLDAPGLEALPQNPRPWGQPNDDAAVETGAAVIAGLQQAGIAARESDVWRVDALIGDPSFTFTITAPANEAPEITETEEPVVPHRPLRPGAVRSLLMMVSVDVPPGFCDALSAEQREAATRWAGATHARAGDNDDVERVEMPQWLRRYYRVSPHLPLGWQTEDPTPPSDLAACKSLALLRNCACAALHRAAVAYGWDSRDRSAEIQALAELATLLLDRKEWEDGSVPPLDLIQVRLLQHFAGGGTAAPDPLVFLHLDEASRLVRRIAEVVGVVSPPGRVDVLRAAAAAELRRALDPREGESGSIWDGCASVFPNPAQERVAILQRIHLATTRLQEPVGPILADLETYLPGIDAMTRNPIRRAYELLRAAADLA